jgi:hypothetical protein
MKLPYFVLYAFLFALFSSFEPTQACEYAGSNITYVKTETEKALAMKDLQLVRFHTYKALDAIAKSEEQLYDCGCEDASERIIGISEILKNAAKTTSLAGTRILLETARENTQESLDALHDHENHDSPYGTDDLSVDTTDVETQKKRPMPPREKLLKQKIDSSLTKYRASLEKTIKTVNCKEARAFATRIYEHCEQQLLRPGLSEGKKYYNLRTKEITGEALEKLGDCGG